MSVTSENAQTWSPENLQAEIARADKFYDISVRDYFSTFATYSRAATILVAAVSFSGEVLSPLHTVAIAVVGAYLCVQWHISTAIMRDQYRYFIHLIKHLENRLKGSGLVTEWQIAQVNARSPGASSSSSSAVKIESTWSHQQLSGLLGMRAAAFPALYGAIFIAIGISETIKVITEKTLFTNSAWVVMALVVGFLALLFAKNERTP